MVAVLNSQYYNPHMKYQFTTDPDDMDVDVIHGFLVSSYWAKGVGRELVEKSILNSFCFGLKYGQDLIAFGRFITDTATFAYLADVFVLAEHRGQGLAEKMMAEVLELPEVTGLRRMMLVTKDAHSLYRKFGFSEAAYPARLMERLDQDIYLRQE